MVCQPRERGREGENTDSVHSSHCGSVGERMVVNYIKDCVLERLHEVFSSRLLVVRKSEDGVTKIDST